MHGALHPNLLYSFTAWGLDIGITLTLPLHKRLKTNFSERYINVWEMMLGIQDIMRGIIILCSLLNIVLVKVKLSHYCHAGAKRKRSYNCYSFLTSSLDGDEWSATCRGCTLPLEKDPSTHWIGDWVGLRAGLDTQVRGKFLCLCRRLCASHPVCSQTLYWLTYPSSLILL
jgi:hypothetical protein